MSLSGDDRAAAIFKPINDANTAAIAAGKPGMNSADLTTLLNGLKQHYGADTTYLTGAAEIAPGSLAADVKIPVSTTGSPAAQSGFTTAPGPLAATGRGKLT